MHIKKEKIKMSKNRIKTKWTTFIKNPDYIVDWTGGNRPEINLSHRKIIVDFYNRGVSQTVLADYYDMSPLTIHLLIRNHKKGNIYRERKGVRDIPEPSFDELFEMTKKRSPGMFGRATRLADINKVVRENGVLAYWDNKKLSELSGLKVNTVKELKNAPSDSFQVKELTTYEFRKDGRKHRKQIRKYLVSNDMDENQLPGKLKEIGKYGHVLAPINH